MAIAGIDGRIALAVRRVDADDGGQVPGRSPRIVVGDGDALAVFGRLDFVIVLIVLGKAVLGVETDAFEMSLRLYAGYYDCVYLAAAFFRDDVLVTADNKFLNATRTDPVYRRYVKALEDI